MRSRYDRGGVGEDGDFEHLTGLDDAGGQAADANLGQAQNYVCRAQKNDDELLAVFVAEVLLQNGRDVGRRRYLDAVGEREVLLADEPREPRSVKREVREELKLVGAVGTFCASGGRHSDLLDGFDLGD